MVVRFKEQLPTCRSIGCQRGVSTRKSYIISLGGCNIRLASRDDPPCSFSRIETVRRSMSDWSASWYTVSPGLVTFDEMGEL